MALQVVLGMAGEGYKASVLCSHLSPLVNEIREEMGWGRRSACYYFIFAQFLLWLQLFLHCPHTALGTGQGHQPIGDIMYHWSFRENQDQEQHFSPLQFIACVRSHACGYHVERKPFTTLTLTGSWILIQNLSLGPVLNIKLSSGSEMPCKGDKVVTEGCIFFSQWTRDFWDVLTLYVEISAWSQVVSETFWLSLDIALIFLIPSSRHSVTAQWPRFTAWRSV